MLNIQNIITQLMSKQASLSAYSAMTGGSNGSYSGTQACFSTVMDKLDKNLNNAASDDELINMRSNIPGVSSASLPVNPAVGIVDAITQQVKSNENPTVDINQMINDYMRKTYTSQTSVITAFSGVTNLPTQVTQMQGALYNQIVSKLAEQVRSELYNSKNRISSSADTDTSIYAHSKSKSEVDDVSLDF